MAKKFSLLLAAVAALALAVPAFASAAAVTDGSGNVLAEGTHITGVSGNTKTVTEGLGTLECSTVEIEAEITANGAGTVEAESVGAGHTATCSAKGKSIEITDATLLNLTSTTAGMANVTLTFVAHLPTVTCHFEGTVTGTYTTHTSSLNINGELEGGGCGEATINGDFALSQSAGGAAVLD